MESEGLPAAVADGLEGDWKGASGKHAAEEQAAATEQQLSEARQLEVEGSIAVAA